MVDLLLQLLIADQMHMLLQRPIQILHFLHVGQLHASLPEQVLPTLFNIFYLLHRLDCLDV